MRFLQTLALAAGIVAASSVVYGKNPHVLVILVDDMGIENFADAVNWEWGLIEDSAINLPPEE